MSGLIVLGILLLGFVALLWWSIHLPPTRPRPRSRYRGPTEIDVHQDLEQAREELERGRGGRP
jgi:hypothetical protein